MSVWSAEEWTAAKHLIDKAKREQLEREKAERSERKSGAAASDGRAVAAPEHPRVRDENGRYVRRSRGLKSPPLKWLPCKYCGIRSLKGVCAAHADLTDPYVRPELYLEAV